MNVSHVISMAKISAVLILIVPGFKAVIAQTRPIPSEIAALIAHHSVDNSYAASEIG